MSLEKILLKINQWGAGAILVAPILMSSKFIFPFVQLKNIYFRGLILILLVTLIWYILESGRLAGKKNYVLYGFILFGLSATIASIAGVNFANSWRGNFERMDGLFHWWLLIVYFVLLINVFRRMKDWLWLFRVSLLTAAALSLVGFFGHGWLIHDNEWSRIGNSAFLGLYMLWNLVFGILAWLNDESKGWRYFYIFSLVFNMLVLLGAASRAPIVGLALGVLTAVVLTWRGSAKKYKIIIGSLAMAVVILGGASWVYRDAGVVKKINFLNRLTHISRQDATTNSRLLVWQSSWQSFKERPILGYGPNNFAYGLNKYYNPKVGEQWFDRAHNFIFDYANTIGLVGLISYLAICAAAFYNIYLIRKEQRIKAAVMAGSLVAYLTTLLFVFDTINTWLPALVFFGFVSSVGGRDKDDRLKFSVPDWSYYPLLAGAIIVTIFGLYGGVVKPARANLLMAKAYQYSVDDYQKSLNYYQQALAEATMGEREIVLQENRYALEAIRDEKFDLKAKKTIFEQAEKDSLALLQKEPHELQVRMVLAQTYLTYAPLNSFYTGEVTSLLQNNLGDSVKRVEMYFMLAQAKALQGDNEGTIEWLEKAYAACNEVDSVYENLMLLYARVKNQEKLDQTAQEYINKFANLSAEQYRKVGQYYFQVGELDKSEEILRERAIPRDPDSWRSYVSLASIYEQKKEYARAVEYLEGVLAEHPNWPSDVQKTVSDYRDELASREP
ncbi:tetratricopeptide repeat protein [Candidatus Kuenenbacteria bacterium]|nr:tetratricopeptide repeat protein [Candidatus Kuenenbacteria bacterium]HOZ36808.1 O-antigen ligase family protein [bacterium]